MSELISSRIDKETLEKVDEFAKEKRYNRSQAVRIILEDWAITQANAKKSVEACT